MIRRSNTSTEDEDTLQMSVVFLKSQLEEKTSDLNLLKDAMQRKDQALQDQISTCDTLRYQLQQSQRTENELRQQLEELSQRDQRQKSDFEERLYDLAKMCEDQTREISILKAHTASTDGKAVPSTDQSHANGDISIERLTALSEELQSKNEQLESSKQRYQTIKSNLRDVEDRLLQCEQSKKLLQIQMESEQQSFNEKLERIDKALLDSQAHLKDSQTNERLVKEQLAAALDLKDETRRLLDSEKRAFVEREAAMQSELKEGELKLKALAERTKDIVQKYTEAKALNASLESERKLRRKNEETAVSLVSANNSELLSLRLKVENLERSSADYKVTML